MIDQHPAGIERPSHGGRSRRGLIVLTGPSHVGKSAVGRALLERLPKSIIPLSVDGTLEQMFPGADPDVWVHIPAAYAAISRAIEQAVSAGSTVVAESTFTYVPAGRPPERHDEVLAHWIKIARVSGGTALTIGLDAPVEVLLRRARRDDRLPQWIVESTFKLHARGGLGHDLAFDTSIERPEAIAERIVKRWSSLPPQAEPSLGTE